jgi:dihydrodipicolinate synthase/N-acetylneuraminate lyase
MDEDLNPGHQAFAAYCHRLLAAGCHGLSVFGTTGEANSLSVNEQLAALEALVESGVPPEKLQPGTGSCAITDTVRLSRAALEAGTAGAPVLPPFYYKGVGDDGLFRFFAEVVERVGDLIVTKTLSGSRQVEQHLGADQLDQCQPVLRLLGPASTQAATPPKPYRGGVG